MGTSSLQLIQAHARLFSLYKQGKIFVPHLVPHGTSVSVVLSNRPSHLSTTRVWLEETIIWRKKVNTCTCIKNQKCNFLFIFFSSGFFLLFSLSLSLSCYVLWFFFILEIKGEVGSNHRISLDPPLVLRIHNKL